VKNAAHFIIKNLTDLRQENELLHAKVSTFKSITQSQVAFLTFTLFLIITECNCNGHSDQCIYDANVAARNASINLTGDKRGGGVCVNCRHYTTGNNCDTCIDGYYRPPNRPQNSSSPCVPCSCAGRSRGTTENCVKDDTHLLEGLNAGDCICKKGYTGPNCNQCAPGYRNYPYCEPCPCNYAGVINPEACDGPCICKANVEGPRCDRCKEGYYDLKANNPSGCSICYCFGATRVCESSDWGVEVISSKNRLEQWKISDLKGTHIIIPHQENNNLVVADDDFPENKPYYWVAPENYLGDKLYSYGGDLRFMIGYTILRGDVSGYYTEDADIIVEGGPDNLRIGHNWRKQAKGTDKTTIILPLREHEWFLLNNDGRRMRSAKREEYTLVLHDLKRLLIRAKFHTDQIEGKLYNVELEKASKDAKTIKKQEGAEKCECPEGYTGLSCTECAPGYRRVNNELVNGTCVKCECNNHAESCDSVTGECINCLHNTEGPNCMYCKKGFYGNPTRGREDDCKPCACPLTIPSNNFSPTCVAIGTEGDFECNECRHPYTGKRCELCKEGYYGDPTVPGGECLPCECGPNVDRSRPGWCDPRTGQCRCEGNTTGWKCDECKENHWGNPLTGTCAPCNCSPRGSLTMQCDKTTGQCICKPGYSGKQCNMCAIGHGSPDLDCPACNCNPIGSTSISCDPITGQCPCRPGVFGQHCSKCLDGYFGFSERGCQPCNCNEQGSESPTCDEVTGQCRCKPFVEGRDCSRCKVGYWNLDSGRGCEPCNCHPIGSLSENCDQMTGQCHCKPGVTGLKCDTCQAGYFGFSSLGCQKCDPCYEPNHICNPQTGKCECPPNTAGRDCRDCSPGTYGLDIIRGCKPCECDIRGSVNNECNNKTGECVCLDGYEGKLCNKCSFGYYRFPNCRRCDCHQPGTKIEACRENGICQCDETGQCPCRANVIGHRCDRCKEGSFSLDADNPLGCFECFCFEKSNRCEQSRFHWSHLSLQSREVSFGISNIQAEHHLGFNIIPESADHKKIGSNYVTDQPYYWKLPKEFLADKVLAYNGYLRFRISARESSRFPEAVLSRYPLVVLQGNHRLILYHYEKSSPTSLLSRSSSYSGDFHQVRLHESQWIQRDNPRYEVTRKHIMIALQKVQYILIRATTGPDAQSARISDFTMDLAADVHSKGIYGSESLAIGVEQCYCPPQYTGSSCQDPNIGYYRKRKPNYLDSKKLIDLVGWAEPCACNNRSRTCDRETGHCYNCTGNTAGPFCNLCSSGYYGDPTRNIPCLPCHCPLPGHSFAEKCESVARNDYVCIDCQKGYTGPKCDQCDIGYYGNPLNREFCQPCNCSPYGSVSQECDRRTGQCICKEGFRGRDCSICLPRHVQTKTGCESCDNPCTGLLLDDLEALNQTVAEFPTANWGNLAAIKLRHITQRLNAFSVSIDRYKHLMGQGRSILQNVTLNFNLETMADILYLKSVDIEKRLPPIVDDTIRIGNEADEMLRFIHELLDELTRVIEFLKRFGTQPGGKGYTIEHSISEAERMLNELKARNYGPKLEDAQRELRKSKSLIERINTILSSPFIDNNFSDRLNRLIALLSETITIVQEKVQKPIQVSLRRIQEGQQVKLNIHQTVEKSHEHAHHTNISLGRANELIEIAREALIGAAVKSNQFPSMVRDLDNATHTIEVLRSLLSRLNPEYWQKYIEECQRHGKDLGQQLGNLKGLFTATENISKHALEAAQVYEKIVKALEAAEEAARRAYAAAEKAYREAYSGVEDSLIKQALKAKERSYELLEIARELRDSKVTSLERTLAEKRYQLQALLEDLLNSERNLELINKALSGLPQDLQQTLKNVDVEISKILGSLGDTHSKIDRASKRIEAELALRVQRLQGGSASGIENLTRIIEKAREDIRTSSRFIANSKTIQSRIRQANEKIDYDLTDLKNRILLSRQKADSIRVSLGSSPYESCYHSYRPPIKPSAANTISLYYAIKDNVKDALLLFISSSTTSDFMAVEMVDRKIRFSWNAGSGTKSLIHPLVIETNDQNLLTDHQWYRIFIMRINNVVKLSVQRTSDSEKAPYEVTGSSDPESCRMDLDETANFYIGGLPDDFEAPRVIKTKKFNGCLYEVTLDGKRIGLWNFKTASGCHGCMEGATEPRDPATFQFKGHDSYALLYQITNYNVQKYLIALQFKTFDENSLLFFSGNPNTGDFISITLQEGHVLYQFSLGSTSQLQLKTRRKYNTGHWVRLAAERDKWDGVLSVDDEEIEGSIKQGQTELDLSDSQTFFGGVTTNFTQQRWPQLTFTPFLGCMKDVQIDTASLNLLNIESHGIVAGCQDQSWRGIEFKGRGFVELNSHQLEEESDFSLTFKTNQSDALLLCSTFQGKPRTPFSHYSNGQGQTQVQSQVQVQVPTKTNRDSVNFV